MARIEHTQQQEQIVRDMLAGRLTNDANAGRLDGKRVNEETGEVVQTNDLRNLGKGLAILFSSRAGKKARCGMKKVVLQGENAISLTTPSPKGMSQHVVIMHQTEDWEVFGCIARPAGAGGKPRIELVPPRYNTWAKPDAEPKWHVAKDGAKSAANAAAWNEILREHGNMQRTYSTYAEKHLLASLEREIHPLYNVPCDRETGQAYEWVWREVAHGYAIEEYSWDHEFEAFKADAVAA